MAKYKQLTHEQRKQIETGLQQQDSFKKIAETIGKDCSTISKEVRSHLICRKTGAYGKPFNDCSLRKKCRQIDICPTCSASKRRPLYCSFCGRCLHTCVSYQRYATLGADSFKELFPVILADNGSEFSDPKRIEFDEHGNRRSYVFYCNASAPYQKGSCEDHHEMILRILPKGMDLTAYQQEQIDLSSIESPSHFSQS